MDKNILMNIFKSAALQLCLYMNLFCLAIFTFLAIFGAITLFKVVGIGISLFLLFFSFIIGYLFIEITIKELSKNGKQKTNSHKH